MSHFLVVTKGHASHTLGTTNDVRGGQDAGQADGCEQRVKKHRRVQGSEADRRVAVRRTDR